MTDGDKILKWLNSDNRTGDGGDCMNMVDAITALVARVEPRPWPRSRRGWND